MRRLRNTENCESGNGMQEPQACDLYTENRLLGITPLKKVPGTARILSLMHRALRVDPSARQEVYTRDRETPRIRVYIWSCVFTHTHHNAGRNPDTHSHWISLVEKYQQLCMLNQILEGVFSKREPRSGLLLHSASMRLRSVDVFCKQMIEVYDFTRSADSQRKT